MTIAPDTCKMRIRLWDMQRKSWDTLLVTVPGNPQPGPTDEYLEIIDSAVEPDKEGNFNVGPTVQLSQLSKDERGALVAVGNDDPILLKYLDKLQIRLGTKLKVVDIVEFDGSMQVEFENNKPIFLSSQISQHLMIRKIL